MNRKQKIIVSVTGIFIVLLILVGLTYGYFLTRINGNTNAKSISITTANLEISYNDNNDIITGDKIQPGITLPTKTFTVTNNGDGTVEYNVGLVNIINNFVNTNDLVYSLSCSSSVTNKKCNGTDETAFPTLNSYIVSNSIDKDEVQTYVITVTYKETNTDQSDDMGKELSAKIDIFDPKSLTIQGSVTNSSENDYVVIHSKEQESQILNDNYKFIGIISDEHKITIKNRKTTTTKETNLSVSKGTPSVSGSKIIYDDEKNVADMDITISNNTVTLDVTKISDGKPPIYFKDAILASAKKGGENRTTLGSTVTEFTSISGENERVLNNAPDDYGTSYYFRGNILDNYVTFAGFTWRIVRINGDGSVRLVLDNLAKNSSGTVITAAFNSSYNDNAFVGYMYGTAGSTTYDATHKNINDSTIKIKVDKWYEDNLKTNYADYLADTLFCNDKTLASNGIGGVTTQLGYGRNTTYYASAERLQYSSGTTSITISKPAFKCAESATNDYSRFTVSATTLSNGKQTNGNLKYPIGLLTADELLYAGIYTNILNRSNYLYNSSLTATWWVMSPSEYLNSDMSSDLLDIWTGKLPTNMLERYNSITTLSIRPSINLKSDVLLDGGDGTKENPYVIK